MASDDPGTPAPPDDRGGFWQDGVLYRYRVNEEGIRPQEVSRAIYRREPYVSAPVRTVDGRDVPVHGKLVAWTKEKALVKWVDEQTNHHIAWVPAGEVTIIPRHEGKADPYDAPDAFGADGLPDPDAGQWWIPPVPGPGQAG